MFNCEGLLQYSINAWLYEAHIVWSDEPNISNMENKLVLIQALVYVFFSFFLLLELNFYIIRCAGFFLFFLLIAFLYTHEKDLSLY